MIKTMLKNKTKIILFTNNKEVMVIYCYSNIPCLILYQQVMRIFFFTTTNHNQKNLRHKR